MVAKKPVKKTTTPDSDFAPPSSKTPAKSTTPTTTPASTSSSSAGFTAPSAASTAPSSNATLWGISSSEQDDPLVGDNTGLLGTTTSGRRTIGSAVSALSTMPATQITAIQQSLVSAGVLKGKYHPGVADSVTGTAWAEAVRDSTRNNQSIDGYLSDLSNTSTIASAAAAIKQPTYSDPAESQTALASAFTTYGLGDPTQADLNAFQSKITSLETSRAADKVGVDVTSQATLYAAQLASKTPGATTHAEASTDADITKAAAAMGVNLNSTARSNIATQVDANAKATGSPDSNLLNQLVAKEFRMPSDPSQLSGDAATVYNDVQKLAGQYLIPMGTASIGSWVTKAIRGQSYAGSLTGDTEAEVEQWLRQQSAIQYPWLAASTQNFQTVTPWDATSAYRTAISDTLQLGNPDAVNLLDPKYSKLLAAGANGAPPDLATIRQTLMTDPTYGYDSTPLALQQAYAMGGELLKGLGINAAGA